MGVKTRKAPKYVALIHDDGEAFADNAQSDVVSAEGAEAGQGGRHYEARPEDGEESDAPAQPVDEVRPFGARQVPHLGHREEA